MTEADLRACIVEIGSSLSAVGAAALADVVRSSSGPDQLVGGADGLPTPSQQKAAIHLAEQWRGTDTEAEQVAFGLLVAQATADEVGGAESVELVWTGPKSPHVAVAMNAEAVKELVDAAQETLLLVSAYTWKVPDVVEKVSDAVKRGVEVVMVLEWHDKDGEPTGFDPVSGLGAPLPEEVSVYHWPPEVRPVDPVTSKMGYLHAKCAVADRRHAFVSSANLTVNAMEWNMELGLVVRGGSVPERIADHFAALIDEGTLVRATGV